LAELRALSEVVFARVEAINGCLDQHPLDDLPVGQHPSSRPPHLRLTDEQKASIPDAYLRSGLIEARTLTD